MWFNTDVTEKLGIKFPIIQGPFGGGLSSVELLATVSSAGGLGSYGVHNLAPEKIISLARRIRENTDSPFALNLWVSDHDADGLTITPEKYRETSEAFRPFYEKLNIDAPEFPGSVSEKYSEQVEAVLEAVPAVYSFVFGVPSADIISRCNVAGIKTIGAATTPAEAVAIEAAGIDMVLATGMDAGGHRPSFLQSAETSLVGTMALVPQVADAVKIPVIAAGGISDARGIAASMMLGAAGVQLGTAFLACNQSGTSDGHRARLLGSAADHTVLSKAFTGRLARFIETGFFADITERQGEALPFPMQAWFSGPMKAAASSQPESDLYSYYAGQGASLLKHHDAAVLFASLVEETSQILNPLNSITT